MPDPRQPPAIQNAFNRSKARRMKHEALLDAAASLFNEKGHSGTNFHELSQRLQVSKRTIYNYVRNKEDLVFQCYRRSLQAHQECLLKARELEASGLEKVRWTVRATLNDHSPPQAVLTEMGALSEEHREPLLEAAKINRTLLEKMVKEGIADGSIVPCNSKVTTYLIFSMIAWVPMWFSRSGKLSLSDVGAAFEDILSFGLRATRNGEPRLPINMPLDAPPKRTQAFDRSEMGSVKTAELLQAATGLFNQQGVAGTSLDDVVERLGVTKGALYYYFDSKEDVLASCYERSLEQMEEYAAMIESHTTSALERLEMYLRSLVRAHTGPSGPLIIFVGLDNLSATGRKRVVTRARRLERRIEKWIVQGVEAGEIRKVNPLLARFAIAGIADWLPQWYRPDGANTPDEIADCFVDLILEGLSPPRLRLRSAT